MWCVAHHRDHNVPTLAGGDDLHLLPGLLCDVAERGPQTGRPLVPQEPQRPELPSHPGGSHCCEMEFFFIEHLFILDTLF